MSTQITHRQDSDGILRQIVSPAELRRILDADGEDYSRPNDFGPDDEWDTDSDA